MSGNRVMTKDGAKVILFFLWVITYIVGAGLLFGYLVEQKIESVKTEIRRIAIEAVTEPTSNQRKESGE